MHEFEKEIYWNDIPVGEENAAAYADLCALWKASERTVRSILHELSHYDNGDNYVLIRSGRKKGFFRTDDEAALRAYKKECLNKGRSNFAPVKKINRILKDNETALQQSVFNNLKAVRTSKGMTQPQVCEIIRAHDAAFDVPMLSKLENGLFLPSPYHLSLLAKIYGVEPNELVAVELFALDVYALN